MPRCYIVMNSLIRKHYPLLIRINLIRHVLINNVVLSNHWILRVVLERLLVLDLDHLLFLVRHLRRSARNVQVAWVVDGQWKFVKILVCTVQVVTHECSLLFGHIIFHAVLMTRGCLVQIVVFTTFDLNGNFILLTIVSFSEDLIVILNSVGEELWISDGVYVATGTTWWRYVLCMHLLLWRYEWLLSIHERRHRRWLRGQFFPLFLLI